MDGNISSALGVIMDSHVTVDVDELPTNQTADITGAHPANDYDLQMTRFVVQRILVPIVTFVGVFGNVISICVLVQRSMTSSTNCYLTALSVFDLLYLVFGFTLSWNHYSTIKSSTAYKYWFPYGRVLVDICSNVSVYLTLTFSFERLIAVCYPMKGRIICTPHRARIISLIVILIVSSCTSLEFFEWRTIEAKDDNNHTVIQIVDTKFAQTTFYRVGYYYFLIITFTFLPLVLLSTFNGLLIRSVLKAMKIRRQMTQVSSQPPSDTTRRHREQQRITGMLIGVVVIFLICQTPNAVLLFYHTYLHLQDVMLEPWQVNYLRIAGNVVNLLILLNASVNFIIYSFMSTKFRRVFLKIFCKYTPFVKHDVTRTYSSYYGHTSMTSRSPRTSRRWSENGDRTRNGNSGNRISGRCVHPVHKSPSSGNGELNIKRKCFKFDTNDDSTTVTTRRSFTTDKETRSSSRPHVKYHMSSVCEHASDSEDGECTETDLTLKEMARARERADKTCQCFHITSLRCLEREDSNLGQSKMADTSI